LVLFFLVFALVINLDLALVSGAEWVVGLKVRVAYGFVVALNVDDAR
jgi:hypothetical protein